MGQVVRYNEIEKGIVMIKMEEREARNTFTPELINGIIEAFDYVRNYKECKAVILTGFDNYFCCGGTKEELMKIYKGEINFNDLTFFMLPLFCDVPVISAMQGHGIGGGFVFGLYSDFTILGKENIYTTNFMKYGFTPGMGGTLVVPARLGNTLGQEMLFTARNYRGDELAKRGVELKVVSKANVVKEAVTLARSLAEKPRLSLEILKKHLSRDLRDRIYEYIADEVKMHDITFHVPEVELRIEKLFGQ
ncbi:MAG: polyketide synthase [Cyclobacteriaceae bacterium]